MLKSNQTSPTTLMLKHMDVEAGEVSVPNSKPSKN